MALGLIYLPAELQTAVISWLFRDADIANLCLVSKHLYGLAMPTLYHSISINVDHWKAKNLECFLTHGHPGHGHVRSLCIDSDELNTEVKALKVAKDALHALPRNHLLSFRYVQILTHGSLYVQEAFADVSRADVR